MLMINRRSVIIRRLTVLVHNHAMLMLLLLGTSTRVLYWSLAGLWMRRRSDIGRVMLLMLLIA